MHYSDNNDDAMMMIMIMMMMMMVMVMVMMVMMMLMMLWSLTGLTQWFNDDNDSPSALPNPFSECAVRMESCG